jgi:hypothetical protein
MRQKNTQQEKHERPSRVTRLASETDSQIRAERLHTIQNGAGARTDCCKKINVGASRDSESAEEI